ncbi:uncharacterized protein NFIA_093040 [Aspergillus fischeri NRRL 181]|uniref:MFS transporter, putative n=1 Tax=Neosartorya fischeri (strain ATCC 1020 / DSM 3700 / CBS 544.65 / FGSC A1164 / JCM 1740 / NRRL 181 / WB 181) TaxID=331117 RepID=A1DIY5_NEOFI|nr:MFS transporter, putative [Aspergillus fischeri NRRL 181]EAW19342.1 MFS transporter, putative [Aspergillus fischeri NRRL 181]
MASGEGQVGFNATPGKIEDAHSEDLTLVLSEEQALARARHAPGDALPICIAFAHDDRDNPRNWGKLRKWYITLFVSMLNVLTCWCAGGIASGATGIAEEFHVSSEVTTLCLSLYVLGFAIGPVLLAPLSEYFGRQPVYVVSWCPSPWPRTSEPSSSAIVCRFLAGCAGGAPLTNTGGSISDLWERNSSGGPMAVYGLSSTFGPPTALVMSGYIGLNAGWRWIFWVLMAITGGFWLLLIFTIPETRHSIILQRKAARVRKQMAQKNLASAATTVDLHAHSRKGLHTLFAITLTRPFRFLFTEPITLCSAVYNGFLYGLVYLFNEAFALVFGPGNGHGFNTGQQGLSFLGMAIGPIIAFCLYPLQERYLLPAPRSRQRRQRRARGTDVDGAVGGGSDPHQSVLVRLDELPLRALDLADHRVLVLRRGHLHRYPEYSELRGGQLPDVLGLGAGGGDFGQERRRRGVPPVREPDVPAAGLRVGVESAGLPGYPPRADPVCVLLLGPSDPVAESVGS